MALKCKSVILFKSSAGQFVKIVYVYVFHALKRFQHLGNRHFNLLRNTDHLFQLLFQFCHLCVKRRPVKLEALFFLTLLGKGFATGTI